MREKISQYIQKLKDARKSSRFRQVVLLYGVNIIGIPIGIVTSIVITRFLGPEEYGDYKFITTLFTMFVLLFSFGFFQAGNRALVLNKDNKKAKELYGAELIITLGLTFVMALFLVMYGLYDQNLKEKGLSTFFLLLIPFSWIFLLKNYFEVLFQADNKINLLAATRFWPKIGFMFSSIIIYFVLFNYTGNKQGLVWTLFLSTQALVFILVILKIKPSFKKLKERIGEILNFNKSFGIQVYFGSLFAVGFGHLTGILISYFGYNNAGVGYYTLALTLSMPLSFIPNVISTTHYKDFSQRPFIPQKLIFITLVLSLAALIFIWLIVGPFIRIFYGLEFEPVIVLTYIVSTGIALQGLADFFNRFLGAHGKGKALRNSSFIVGLSLLILSLILIPKFGEKGAAVTKAITGLIYALNMYIYYKIHTSKLRKINYE